MKMGLVILSCTTGIFATSFIIAIIRLRIMTLAFMTMFRQHEKLNEYVDKFGINTDISKNVEDIHNENFIKFLSDSRNWAFQYIEDVQLGLKTFIETVEEDINYFDQYGEAGPTGPNADSLKIISAAYKDLIKLVPMEEKE